MWAFAPSLLSFSLSLFSIIFSWGQKENGRPSEYHFIFKKDLEKGVLNSNCYKGQSSSVNEVEWGCEPGWGSWDFGEEGSQALQSASCLLLWYLIDPDLLSFSEMLDIGIALIIIFYNVKNEFHFWKLSSSMGLWWGLYFGVRLYNC